MIRPSILITGSSQFSWHAFGKADGGEEETICGMQLTAKMPGIFWNPALTHQEKLKSFRMVQEEQMFMKHQANDIDSGATWHAVKEGFSVQ